jgi:Predicted acetyltransferase
MVIEYKENSLVPTDFNYLRRAVEFSVVPEIQAEQAINKGLFSIIALHENRVIGMGRLVGDGIMYWYIQDIVVLPEYQGRGIGKAIVERLIRFVEYNSIPKTSVTIGLMSAKGKDAFYEKLGFISRPSDIYGSGMIKIITTHEH